MPSDPVPTLSVVAPMCNERECVDEFLIRVDSVLDDVGEPAEIVLVSDGSTDGTSEMLLERVATHPRLRVVVLDRNVGQALAIDAGFQHSRGRYVVVLDGDLQNPPEAIPDLLEVIRRDDLSLVSGSRVRHETEPWLARRIPSLAANWLLRRITGCPVRDMAGFKIIRGDVARSLRLRSGQHRLIPAIVHVMGGRTGEIPVPQAPRFAGTSKYRTVDRLLDVVIDVMLLWLQASAKRRPIYLFGRIAFLLLAADCLIMPILLWDKFVHGQDMGTRPPFLIAIMFALAALFIVAAGFILELLSDSLAASSGVRPYVVRQIAGGDDPEPDAGPERRRTVADPISATASS